MTHQPRIQPKNSSYVQGFSGRHLVRIAIFSISVSGAGLPCGGAVANPAEPSPLGFWERGDGKAKVRIEVCGDDMCAINTWIKPGTHDEKVGDKLIMTVKQGEPAKWLGKATDPQRNLTYHLTITMMEPHMTTQGCVLGNLICKSMSWTRLASAEYVAQN